MGETRFRSGYVDGGRKEHVIARQQRLGRGDENRNQKSRYPFDQYRDWPVRNVWRVEARRSFSRSSDVGIREGRKGGAIEKGEEVGNRKSICPLVGFERNWDTEGVHPKRSGRDGDTSSVSREQKQTYLIDLKLLLAGATRYGTSN